MPELPHIELRELPTSGTRKLEAVRAFAGSRALAWVDDELYDDAVIWAEAREAPTLLRRTAAGVGLVHDDIVALADFAAALRPPV